MIVFCKLCGFIQLLHLLSNLFRFSILFLIYLLSLKVACMDQTPPEKLLIGAHTSAAGGVSQAVLKANLIEATTFQFFTSNQKQWHGKEISDEEAHLFLEFQKRYDYSHIMSHGSYLINLGSIKEDLRQKSQEAFERELKRCHKLKLSYLNFHPGAYTTGVLEESLDLIVESLLSLEKLCSEGPTRLLLETTAGQGTSIGHKFEHLNYIIERVKNYIPIGVCIDTCHIFAAGYDIRSFEAWEKTLLDFENVIGLKHLYAFHLNDSKHDLGLKKDRHANLGHGKIGLDCFHYLMTDPKVRALPKYLETPNGEIMWKDEIALLKDLATKEKALS